MIFVEKKPLCDVLLLNLRQAILAAFYCFDLLYSMVFINFFSLFEMLVVNHDSHKPGTKVEALFIILFNT